MDMRVSGRSVFICGQQEITPSGESGLAYDKVTARVLTCLSSPGSVPSREESRPRFPTAQIAPKMYKQQL
ncbi:hypothetical protein L596_003812 [Steinernema carpocapsae]|uniref:Uncharacterized protein n=1 Tax=Steinernema carpocapsae TaxID=34508 RepID=A0A4U8UVD4_STECR|nr:hypothetical protein L596_003812 [Steinernema carpocapsae]